MNKIENRILENQNIIMYALSSIVEIKGLLALSTRLEYEIKETNKLMKTEERSF